MDHRDLASTPPPGEVVGESHHPAGFRTGDHAAQLGALAVVADGLADTGVDALDVLPHRDDVDVLVAGVYAGQRQGRADVGVQVEVLAQGDVDRGEPLAHRRGDGPLEHHAVALDQRARFIGQQLVPGIERALTGQAPIERQAAVQLLQ